MGVLSPSDYADEEQMCSFWTQQAVSCNRSRILFATGIVQNLYHLWSTLLWMEVGAGSTQLYFWKGGALFLLCLPALTSLPHKKNYLKKENNKEIRTSTPGSSGVRYI